jgi:hypothetical protein
MKIKAKLKITGRRSLIAYLIAALSSLYFFMASLKGMYLFTHDSTYTFPQKINFGAKWIINETWFFPIDYFWKIMPAVPFSGQNILEFYQVIIPPAIVFGICALFILDHKLLKKKFHELKCEIEREISLQEMRKEAGLQKASESATVDIMISNAINNDPAWHDTWWGKVVIGVAILLVAAAIGLGN